MLNWERSPSRLHVGVLLLTQNKKAFHCNVQSLVIRQSQIILLTNYSFVKLKALSHKCLFFFFAKCLVNHLFSNF